MNIKIIWSAEPQESAVRPSRDSSSSHGSLGVSCGLARPRSYWMGLMLLPDPLPNRSLLQAQPAAGLVPWTRSHESTLLHLPETSCIKTNLLHSHKPWNPNGCPLRQPKWIQSLTGVCLHAHTYTTFTHTHTHAHTCTHTHTHKHTDPCLQIHSHSL